MGPSILCPTFPAAILTLCIGQTMVHLREFADAGLPRRPAPGGSFGVLREADYQDALGAPDGSIWVADDVQAVWLSGRSGGAKTARTPTKANIRPGPLLSGRDGQIWFLGEALVGLTSPVEFRDRADNDRYSPLAGFEDERRHLWIAALGRGLVEWIRDPQWQSWFPMILRWHLQSQAVCDPSGALLLATREESLIG